MNSYSKTLAALILAAAGVAQATTIVGATGVTSTLGTYQTYGPSNMINQSGLSTPYVSGTSNFQSVVANTTADGLNAINQYFSAAGNKVGDLVFDLGTATTLGAMALWSGHSNQSNQIKDFSLYDADTDTLLGTYSALMGPTVPGSPSQVIAQVFTFSPVTTQHIKLHVSSNRGGSLLAVSEVAFEQVQAPTAAVPEPASMALMACGLALVAGARRRRQQA